MHTKSQTRATFAIIPTNILYNAINESKNSLVTCTFLIVTHFNPVSCENKLVAHCFSFV